MKNYAIFVATTPRYKKHVNALLNSFEKRKLCEKCYLTVYVLHYGGINRSWLIAISEVFSFNVITVEIKENEVKHPENMKEIEFVKRARFKYILKYAGKYDVICLLDADMFIVSPDFMKLFDLVNGTNQLIGCNEAFKWGIGGNYTYEGQPIFQEPQKLFNMHCSVPIIFDSFHWEQVFSYYLKIAYFGEQEKGGKIVGIGDIMSWNISVQKCGKEADIVTFPMETMCQVHQTYLYSDRYVVVENGYWRTARGDRLYSIQGRWNTGLDFVEGSQEWCEKNLLDYDKAWPNIKKGLEYIQQEWYNLNFYGKLILDEENIWEKFNRGVL